MVGVEGRPKRACAADGKIDYAGTDQVPGWTVRVFFFFVAFLSSRDDDDEFQTFSPITPRLNDLYAHHLTALSLSFSLSLSLSMKNNKNRRRKRWSRKV
jgi:hypothetical protein